MLPGGGLVRRSAMRHGPYRVKHLPPQQMAAPCASRWQLKLAKARMWDEHIDPTEKTAWQVEDERHMSPEYNEFTGYAMRKMKPGAEGTNTADYQFRKKLPQHSAMELQNRRDVPYQDNVRWGKTLHDETIYGMSVPYSYALFKEWQKASRNDRGLKQNKFRILQGTGFKNPPSGFTVDTGVDEDDED
eukprot:CAMPEP_0174831192 /NCGR_PEP_ID=MMETSP1114-20130205/2963_1 /TAXON_ID=312471 /ORGANISM="Neobodo designis, Strain CCAP 1951/1" /LENGTH=187 /DNA_ID=CAMNT_0016065013 /DNA_START=38 /DNA_END=601 /DNA_ORIENTATION=-